LPRAANSVALLLAVVLAACRTAAPPRIARVPDPLAPPVGGGPLMVVQADAVRAAVAAAENGDFAAAEQKLLEVPPGHPVRALASLEVRFLRGEAVAGQALELAGSVPGYGSAWGFAAVAARHEQDERGALNAARRAAELQPDGAWGRVAAELEATLTTPLLGEGSALLKGGDPRGALARAREALEVNPNTAGARILAVRALLALNETRGAAELVPGLPDTPDGLELKGSVAEALGQWDLAVDFYSRMPADDPRRCAKLAAARRQLRLTNAPPYLSEALAARPLLRRGLAAIVAWESPALTAKVSGPVPVFEDVVQLQEARDVVTVARAGVMPGDSIAHRFNPEARVSPHELAATLERLAGVLGKPAPRWCSDGEGGCVELPEVVDGESAMALVRRVSGGGGDPCAQR
jgi:tetratricopeptide (TPR) repeat protein